MFEELPVLIDHGSISASSTLEEFRIIGPSILDGSASVRSLVRTHDVDTCKVECLSWQVWKAAI